MTCVRSSRPRPVAGFRGRQSGAVLIVSLVLLVVLTLLGVTAMNTTSLEEKMAANSQETTRAFHSAETGLSLAFVTEAAYDLKGGYTQPVVTIAGTTDTVLLSSDFMGWSPPPPGTLWGQSVQAANFDFRSEGNTSAGIEVVLRGGAYQLAPKQN